MILNRRQRAIILVAAATIAATGLYAPCSNREYHWIFLQPGTWYRIDVQRLAVEWMILASLTTGGVMALGGSEETRIGLPSFRWRRKRSKGTIYVLYTVGDDGHPFPCPGEAPFRSSDLDLAKERAKDLANDDRVAFTVLAFTPGRAGYQEMFRCEPEKE